MLQEMTSLTIIYQINTIYDIIRKFIKNIIYDTMGGSMVWG